MIATLVSLGQLHASWHILCMSMVWALHLLLILSEREEILLIQIQDLGSSSSLLSNNWNVLGLRESFRQMKLPLIMLLWIRLKNSLRLMEAALFMDSQTKDHQKIWYKKLPKMILNEHNNNKYRQLCNCWIKDKTRLG